VAGISIYISESELLYNWRFTTNQFVLATSPLRPTTRIFIFQLNTCGYSSLKLLWASPAQPFLGPNPAGLMTKLYCLRFETSPAWLSRSLYLYPPGKGWPLYTSWHSVPFSSPPTTSSATVEVFDPASTWVILSTYYCYFPFTKYWVLDTTGTA
jgi:hypothetical protein